MCLRVNNNDVKQIASEDIVCYKQLIHTFDFTSYVGQSFTGIIKGIECKGKIQIEFNITFFCTDDMELNGLHCYDKLGYKYSWTLDSRVQSIILDGDDVLSISKDSIFITPYQKAKVKIGETYISDLVKELDEDNNSEVNIGLHSYANYNDARRDGSDVIVKCIIPKGAEYYVGLFRGDKSYASNQLKYLELIIPQN